MVAAYNALLKILIKQTALWFLTVITHIRCFFLNHTWCIRKVRTQLITFQTFSAGNFTFMLPFLITDIPPPASPCFYIDSVSNSFPFYYLEFYGIYHFEFLLKLCQENNQWYLRPLWSSDILLNLFGSHTGPPMLNAVLFSFVIRHTLLQSQEDTPSVYHARLTYAFQNKTRNSKLS